jgi:dihydrofolate reductase
MVVHAILSVDPRGGIGNAGRVPWPVLETNARRFRSATRGNTVITGRRIHEESLPLHECTKLVVGTGHLTLDECTSYVERAAQWLRPVVVIGGILADLVDHVQILHLTRLLTTFQCDTTVNLKGLERAFPHVIWQSMVYQEHGIPYYFEIRTRRAIQGC